MDSARLIPARAGNMSASASGPSRRPAHPRSRGEHLGRSANAEGRIGSSPLARGTSVLHAEALVRTRLIPARAGNIVAYRPRRLESSAHPRSRGEHIKLEIVGLSGVGSSPLARGTLDNTINNALNTRLIPARAGNIRYPIPHHYCQPAHPRSRGEHWDKEDGTKGYSGSSPLARGTSKTAAAFLKATRLIPARAGNIHQGRRWNNGAPAHPRSRGEHQKQNGHSRHGYGSSPLARGTFRLGGFRASTRRLIPARAGNMGFLPVIIGYLPAHPRSRGEHILNV